MGRFGGIGRAQVVVVAVALLFTVAGCGDRPSAEDVAARWPDSVGELSRPSQGTEEHYAEVLLDGLDGVSDIDLYTFDAGTIGPLSVLVVTGEDDFTDAQVNQLRCNLGFQVGTDVSENDDYAGERGMHGSGGSFSVSVDGIAVLVQSTLTDEQARKVAEALGGEGGPLTTPCDDSRRPRIAG